MNSHERKLEENCTNFWLTDVAGFSSLCSSFFENVRMSFIYSLLVSSEMLLEPSAALNARGVEGEL